MATSKRTQWTFYSLATWKLQRKFFKHASEIKMTKMKVQNNACQHTPMQSNKNGWNSTCVSRVKSEDSWGDTDDDNEYDHEDDTPWKFNIAPENKPSQKESNLQTLSFQGLC